MPISYNKLLMRLKDSGYNTYTLRQKKILGEKTLQAFREGKPVRTDIIGRMCQLLECQPGDLLEYLPEDENNT